MLAHVALPADDQVHDCLSALGRLPLLTTHEEIGLAKQIEAGLIAEEKLASSVLTRTESRELAVLREAGLKARDRFVGANLRLVVSIVKRHQYRGLDFMDLIQEGNIGLMKAVEGFDYRREFKFSTYATWWIRQSISRAVSDKGRAIRIPVHMDEKMRAADRVNRTLSAELGREPTLAEVARTVGVGSDEVRDYIEYDQAHLSLERCASASETGYQRPSITSVTPSVSRERIRQIESKTMAKLRHPSKSQLLSDYLDEVDEGGLLLPRRAHDPQPSAGGMQVPSEAEQREVDRASAD